MKYSPTKKSLHQHQVPEWYHNAKFGIFIHWGLFSIPAFAPTGNGTISELLAKENWKGVFRNQPYAEWYLNSLRILGSPVHEYHQKKYGDQFHYENFQSEFNRAIERWNPKEWADLFQKAGARYVVLVTKHHDGFCLWPSQHSNPRRKDYSSSRNIVKELSEAVIQHNMRMGYYYSSALDWTFTTNPIESTLGLITNGSTEKEYADYVYSQWHELITEYDPSIIWGDIAFPKDCNLLELFAFFYNKNPEGVVNDRWAQMPKFLRKGLKWKSLVKFIDNMSRKVWLEGKLTTTKPIHCDFFTPEYSSFSEIMPYKWECTRGMGKSFAYNQMEKDEEYINSTDLVHSFVDIVSKNGNLLLNVGPMADGTIPDVQQKILIQFGKWLNINSEAIYDTRPWIKAETVSGDNVPIRFTQKNNSLFVIVLGTPIDQLIIPQLLLSEKSKIELLIAVQKKIGIDWIPYLNGIKLKIPIKLPIQPAYAIKITPIPK